MFLSLSYLANAEDGLWRMAVDKRKLSQVVALIAAAVPDIVSLHEQIHTLPGTWYAALDLANAPFWYLSIKTPEAVCF